MHHTVFNGYVKKNTLHNTVSYHIIKQTISSQDLTSGVHKNNLPYKTGCTWEADGEWFAWFQEWCDHLPFLHQLQLISLILLFREEAIDKIFPCMYFFSLVVWAVTINFRLISATIFFLTLFIDKDIKYWYSNQNAQHEHRKEWGSLEHKDSSTVTDKQHKAALQS